MQATRVTFSRYASFNWNLLEAYHFRKLGNSQLVGSPFVDPSWWYRYLCLPLHICFSCWVAEFQDRVGGCSPWISCPNFQMCGSVHNYLRKQEFQALVFSGGREEALSFLYSPIGFLWFSVSKSVMVTCNFCASSQRTLGTGATTNLSEDQLVLIIYRAKTLREILFSIGPIIGALRN